MATGNAVGTGVGTGVTVGISAGTDVTVGTGVGAGGTVGARVGAASVRGDEVSAGADGLHAADGMITTQNNTNNFRRIVRPSFIPSVLNHPVCLSTGCCRPLSISNEMNAPFKEPSIGRMILAGMYEDDLADPPTLIELLDEAVQLAEELAAPPAQRWAADRLRYDLIPALYDARSYAEIGVYRAAEIRLGLSGAAAIASDLLDTDPRYGPLYSRLRVLQEEAGSAARG